MKPGLGALPKSIKDQLKFSSESISDDIKNMSENLIFGTIYKLTSFAQRGMKGSVDVMIKCINYIILLI